VSIELDLELADDLPLMEPSPTLWWRAGATDTRAVDLVQVRYGFVPTSWIHFRLRAGEIDEQLDEMAALVATVLAASDGDALLHADFEDVWLLRRGGQLVLSDEDARWPARRRSGFGELTRAALDARPF